MELTLTTEFMSGMSGTRICGDEAHDAARCSAGSSGQIDDDAANTACVLGDFGSESFLRRRFRAEVLRIERDHLDGRVAARGGGLKVRNIPGR